MSDMANEIMAMAALLPTSPNARPHVELRVGAYPYTNVTPGAGYGIFARTKHVFLFEEDGTTDVRIDSNPGSKGDMASMGRFSEPALKGMIEGIIRSGRPAEIYVGVKTETAVLMKLEEMGNPLRDEDLDKARAFFENCAQVCKGWIGPSHPRV
jgi:hypothetical protein